MACPCDNSITVITPTVTCTDCLIAKTVRYGCDNAPDPCGEEVSIDLSEINNVEVCKDCSAVYTIKKFDAAGFSSVSITSDGVLTFTTSNEFVKQKEYEITYKITCPCSSPNLSTTAKVYVCKKDLCRTSPVGSACDKCTGNFIFSKDHTVLAADSDLHKCGGSDSFNVSSIVEKTVGLTLTYSLVGHTAGVGSVTINPSTGLINFSKVGSTYTTQEIKYAASSGVLYNEGSLFVQIKNLCTGVNCADGFVCNECTGVCDEVESDLQLS